MGKGRVEAFSDGVIAIIITIMVLELRVPQGAALADLAPLAPVFLSYALSFVYVGIYWNNHHHMLQAVKSVSGAVLWANLHLLFWLSVVPFVTAWMGQHPLATPTVAVYGGVLLMNAIAYTVLQTQLIRHEGPDSPLAKATQVDIKGRGSMAIYVLGIGAAFILPAAALALYVAVAVIWFIPDRRVERQLGMDRRD
jgi:uncharacterized membrane protein